MTTVSPMDENDGDGMGIMFALAQAMGISERDTDKAVPFTYDHKSPKNYYAYRPQNTKDATDTEERSNCIPEGFSDPGASIAVHRIAIADYYDPNRTAYKDDEETIRTYELFCATHFLRCASYMEGQTVYTTASIHDEEDRKKRSRTPYQRENALMFTLGLSPMSSYNIAIRSHTCTHHTLREAQEMIALVERDSKLSNEEYLGTFSSTKKNKPYLYEAIERLTSSQDVRRYYSTFGVLLMKTRSPFVRVGGPSSVVRDDLATPVCGSCQTERFFGQLRKGNVPSVRRAMAMGIGYLPGIISMEEEDCEEALKATLTTMASISKSDAMNPRDKLLNIKKLEYVSRRSNDSRKPEHSFCFDHNATSGLDEPSRSSTIRPLEDYEGKKEGPEPKRRRTEPKNIVELPNDLFTYSILGRMLMLSLRHNVRVFVDNADSQESITSEVVVKKKPNNNNNNTDAEDGGSGNGKPVGANQIPPTLMIDDRHRRNLVLRGRLSKKDDERVLSFLNQAHMLSFTNPGRHLKLLKTFSLVCKDWKTYCDRHFSWQLLLQGVHALYNARRTNLTLYHCLAIPVPSVEHEGTEITMREHLMNESPRIHGLYDCHVFASYGFNLLVRVVIETFNACKNDLLADAAFKSSAVYSSLIRYVSADTMHNWNSKNETLKATLEERKKRCYEVIENALDAIEFKDLDNEVRIRALLLHVVAQVEKEKSINALTD